MSRIFLLGTGPLLEQSARVMSGQCLRTWHFAAPMLAAGHDVQIATIPIPGATRHDDPALVSADADYQGRSYYRFGENAPHEVLPRLRGLIAERGPFDAVVGVNAHPAYLLALADSKLPFWADLNGWTMAEGTSRAAIVGDDGDFGHFWRQEVAVLLAADRFSTVSQRQAWALWGELAVLGKLGSGNFDQELVEYVPNAVYPDYAKLERRPGTMPGFLRDRLPEGSPICLWTGGFNTWTNVDMLTAALARAMEQEPSLCFVSTGGAVVGHDEKTYERYLQLAGERLPEGRVVNLGWAPLDQVIALHAAATMGINIDGNNIETRFGARNRVTNMLGAGLPVITTRGTEIAEWMEHRRCGRVINQGEPAALAEALLDAVRQSGDWERQASRDRDLALQDFAPEFTLRAFLGWCSAPARVQVTPGGSPPAPQDRLREMLAEMIAREQPFHPQPAPPQEGFRGRLRHLIRSLKGVGH
jgi:glycosyltransferase involved in cell wall biosynthesis